LLYVKAQLVSARLPTAKYTLHARRDARGSTAARTLAPVAIFNAPIGEADALNARSETTNGGDHDVRHFFPFLFMPTQRTTARRDRFLKGAPF
jgi:hypothetical protein